VHAALVVVIGGLSEAVPLFLIASGLTLIYGVMGILNFAHGGLFMFGAYLLTSVFLRGNPPSLIVFAGAVILSAIIVAFMGLAAGWGLFRPLQREEPQVSLLASYGLLLFLVGLAPVFWGNQFLSQAPPAVLAGHSRVLGVSVGRYNLMEIGLGIVVAIGLTLLLKKTPIGVRATALAEDREMARALGVSARRVDFAVFAIGSLLAGLAGALIAPTVAVSTNLAQAFIIQAFAVVLVGGLGSVGGALLGAIILGVVDTALGTYVPWLEAYSFYLSLGLFVALRPQGLFGRFSEATSR
jgi:branched-chain amino acid transport system permease protein